jgi:hypothetical protein
MFARAFKDGKEAGAQVIAPDDGIDAGGRELAVNMDGATHPFEVMDDDPLSEQLFVAFQGGASQLG